MSEYKCSFCYTEDKDRVYWPSLVEGACICGNCCIQYAMAILEKQSKVGTNESEDDMTEKNQQFQTWLSALEDKWMEKNIINTFILDAGGVLNEVHFRFEDDEDGYYLVCELEVENIDTLPDDAEENIYNEIEWAFDEIRDELEENGLDLDAYFGEKLILKRVG